MVSAMKVKEGEKLGKYLDLARKWKEIVEHDGEGDTYRIWNKWNNIQEPGKESRGTVDLRELKKSRPQDY